MGAIYLDGTTPGVPSLDLVVAQCFPYVRRVITLDGWKRRARSTGGYSGRAKGVSHHHDAGGIMSDGLPAAMYETFTAEAKPIGNLHLSRICEVFVMAGGSTNTIGAGGPMGDFAKDQGNAHQIGIEAGNRGTGEVWPPDMIRAYLELSARLWVAYHEPFGWDLPANNPNQFFDHRRWAPGRKIDRKGEAIFEFNGREIVLARGYSYWDTELYYEVVTERIEQILTPVVTQPTFPPIPTPIPGDDDMQKTIILDSRNNGVYLADAIAKTWCNDGNTAAQLKYRVMEAQGIKPDYTQPPQEFPASLPPTAGVAIDGYHYCIIRHGDPHVIASFGPFLGPVPPGFDQYGR